MPNTVHLARGWLGLRLARNWSLGARNEAFRRATLAVTGDVWHEALAENAMTLAAFDGSNPETFRSDIAGTWGEFGPSATARLTETLSIYGGGRYAFDFDGERHAWAGHAGLRFNW